MSSGKTEKTVFFGSGPVAARSLSLLLQHTDIEAVITKPRPPHHRGSVPVLELAELHGLPVVTVSTKSDVDAALDTHGFTSRYGVLIDFGIIVSQVAIDYFPLGIINSHFSLLPKLRGADPITWSIVNGDTQTGVSLMLVDKGMDTGSLLAQDSLALNHTETTPTLTSDLIELSDQMLQTFVPQHLSGSVSPYDQPNQDLATYSRKLDKSDSIIDWSKSAINIERKIRAFLDWPQSRATIGRLDVIITQAHVIKSAGSAGDYAATDKELIVFTSDQALSIDKVKPAGKKEMPIGAFLSGYKNQL